MSRQQSSGDYFGQFFSSVGNAVASHHASSPREQAITRAQLGTFLLVLAGYAVPIARGLTGYSADELVDAFLRSPADLLQAVPVPLAIWGCTVLLGSVWLIAGLRGSGGGPRQGMKIFWGLVRIALLAGAMHWAESASADWRGWVWLVDRFLIALLAAEIVGVCLEMRSGGRAKDVVLDQIEDAEIPWRPAGRR